MELIIRFDYGWIVPWVRRLDDGRVAAIAGPDRLVLGTPVQTRGENLTTVAEFTIGEGREIPFVLSWAPSHAPIPEPINVSRTVRETTEAWTKWSAAHDADGCPEWQEAVLRSAITLKALTHWQTGGIVAAPTTSLPEELGGPRNWDYRFCWLRDATITLYALMSAGFIQEASAWREWLLRAIAGTPDQMQIMYGVAGERRMPECELPWLQGYEGSRPVRVGNAAASQLQLDVYGEVLDALFQARRLGLGSSEAGWRLERNLTEHL